MTKLDCTVTNCFYNDDKSCCKGDIMVEGEEARESGSTCCGSFVEKKSSTAKNIGKAVLDNKTIKFSIRRKYRCVCI